MDRTQAPLADAARCGHRTEARLVFPAQRAVGGSRIVRTHGKTKSPDRRSSASVWALGSGPLASSDGEDELPLTSRALDRQLAGLGLGRPAEDRAAVERAAHET